MSTDNHFFSTIARASGVAIKTTPQVSNNNGRANADFSNTVSVNDNVFVKSPLVVMMSASSSASSLSGLSTASSSVTANNAAARATNLAESKCDSGSVNSADARAGSNVNATTTTTTTTTTTGAGPRLRLRYNNENNANTANVTGDASNTPHVPSLTSVNPSDDTSAATSRSPDTAAAAVVNENGDAAAAVDVHGYYERNYVAPVRAKTFAPPALDEHGNEARCGPTPKPLVLRNLPSPHGGAEATELASQGLHYV